MKTLEHLSEEKRQRIAAETLDIYAPIANRLGIGWLKTEFEDLSFKFMMPELHEEIVKKIAKRKERTGSLSQRGCKGNRGKAQRGKYSREGLIQDKNIPTASIRRCRSRALHLSKYKMSLESGLSRTQKPIAMQSWELSTRSGRLCRAGSRISSASRNQICISHCTRQ